MSLLELFDVLNKIDEKLNEALKVFYEDDYYRYSLVYKEVRNRKGTPYRYLYLNKYDWEGVKSKYIGKVDNEELASKLEASRFREVLRSMNHVRANVKLLLHNLRYVVDLAKVYADLYDYLEAAVKEGKIDGSKEQVQIALKILKPFKDLVQEGDVNGSV